jgi:secondary thiamine-phosphate synthase enzyme
VVAVRQAQGELGFRTPGRGLTDITRGLTDWMAAQPIADGLLTVFIRHTSASLLIQENADPDVLADLDAFFGRIAPDDTALYRHVSEGADDMPAHIRSALTQTSLQIPAARRRLLLGTWQGVYLFEHRARPHERRLALHLIGE